MTRKLHMLGALVVAASTLSACATKQYPIATELSSTETHLMGCRELVLEDARTEEIQLKINETATTNWRSVAGFLGDYGIGNAMAKSDAEKALSQRRISIKSAMARKNCIPAMSSAPAPGAFPG